MLGPRPELAAAYATLEDRLWADGQLDRRLLELCRLRIAQLLDDRDGINVRTAAAGPVGDDVVAALAAWPSDPRFTPAERAALGVAELFVIDVHAVGDDAVAALRRELGDGAVVGLMVAFGLFDGASRLRRALGSPP
jgi:alkylhydroperoxidase family enzyme